MNFVVCSYGIVANQRQFIIVGSYETVEEAKAAALIQFKFRGGKYSVQIVECGGELNERGENVKQEILYRHRSN